VSTFWISERRACELLPGKIGRWIFCTTVAGGRTICVLSLVDNFTRECLALQTIRRLELNTSLALLDHVITRPGTPKALRMDNGPQMTSRCFLAWCVWSGRSRQTTSSLVSHFRPGMWKASAAGWIAQPELPVKAAVKAHSHAALTDEPGRRTPNSEDEKLTGLAMTW